MEDKYKITTLDDKTFKKFKGSKWRNDKEFDTYKLVSERFRKMEDHKETSCPFPVPADELESISSGSVSTAGNTNNSWPLHWRRMERNKHMISEYIEGRSNIKSATSFAPVEAAIAEAINSNPDLLIEAEDEDDDGKVIVLKRRLDVDGNKRNFKLKDINSITDALIYGTSVVFNCYVLESGDKERLMNPKEREEEIELAKTDKKKSKEIETRLEKDKKPLTKMITGVEYAGVDKVIISPFDFYLDPDAKALHKEEDPFNYAKDCIMVTRPSVDSIKEFLKTSTDAYIIKENIDLIESAKECYDSYSSGSMMINSQDIALQTKDATFVVHYFNTVTKRYEILVNDVLVRSGKMPYNHGRLPFSMPKWSYISGLIWGRGMVSQLEHNQGETELHKNLEAETEKFNGARPIVAHTDVFPDLVSQMGRLEPNMIIETSSEINESKLFQFPARQLTQGHYQYMQSLETERTEISRIAPMMYATPMNNQPVRNNVMTQESSQRSIKQGLFFWSQGLVESNRQFFELIIQFDPESMNKKDGNYYGKKLKVKGYRLEKDELGKINEKKIDGNSTYQMELEDYNLKGKISITVNPDNLVPPSRSLRMQNSERAMNRYTPIFLKFPQVLQYPIFVDLLRWDMKENQIPTEIIDKLQSEDSEEEMMEAHQENQMIEASVLEDRPDMYPQGQPGRSERHKNGHAYRVMELSMEMNELMSTDPNKVEIDVDQAMERVDNIRSVIDKYIKHMQIDATPKEGGDEMAMQNAMALMAPQPPMGDPMMQDPNMMGAPVDPAMQMQGIGAQDIGAMPEQMPM